jgi:predicted dehydrogenase
MKKKRIGVIGYGMRLQGVIEKLQAQTDEIVFPAVHDPSATATAAFRERLNPSAQICTTVDELLGCNLDWVMIGSWNCQHADHAVAALLAGCHVFCEKPLALSVVDCLRIREAWQQSGKLFSLGFTLRYSPHYSKIHEVVSSGRLGRILSMEFNEVLDFNHGGYIHADWRRRSIWAGSHLLEKCCHDLDLANWIVGSRVARAVSFGGCDFFTPANAPEMRRVGRDAAGRDAFMTWHQLAPRPIPGASETPFGVDKDILDNQVVLFEYENGSRATFHTSCLSALPERRMLLCGTRGTLRSDVISGTIEFREIGFDTQLERLDTGSGGGHGGGDDLLARCLAESMMTNSSPGAGIQEGLEAAFAAFAADESQRTGQVVELHSLWSSLHNGNKNEGISGA